MRQRAQQAAHHGAVKGRGRALAANVAKQEDRFARAVLEDVVDVAGDFTRRAQADGHVQAFDFRGFARQHDELHIAGGFEIAVHPLLALRDFFVQARVFDRACDLGSEQCQQSRVLFGEVAHALALQIHHAHHAILDDERNGNFRADVGVGSDVTLVSQGIGDAYDFARFGGRAGEAFAERDVVEIHALVIALAETMAQYFAVRVEEQNAERVEGDEGMGGGGDLAQQFVQIQDGTELLRQVRECLQRAILAVDAAIEPRVVDGDRDAGGDQLEQGAILLAIGGQARGLQIDDAHQLAAREHRDGELGLDGIERGEIAGIVVNIGGQDRLAIRCRDAGDAFAERDYQVSHYFLAMADGITDAKPVLALAVKQDGEEIVGNDIFHNGGDVGENAVQIERVRSCGGNIQEKIEEFCAFLETDFGFAGRRGHHAVPDSAARAASTIWTLALAPIRVAPASSIFSKSSSVRIPPEAFTPISGPTARRISSTS